MKGRSIDAKIASLIVLAQIASDAGKGLYRLDASNLCTREEIRRAENCGYSVKPEYIARAISLINSIPKGCWRYWAIHAPDQNGNPSTIVYFECRGIGRTLQASFHNPKGCDKMLASSIGKGQLMRWKHGIDGSVSATRSLIKYFGR